MKPYLLILLTLCTLGCHKTDPFPTPSFTPGYYFYCKVDGEEFVPARKSGLGDQVKWAFYNDSSLLIGCLSTQNEEVNFHIYNTKSNYYSLNKLASYSNYDNWAYYSPNATSLYKPSTDSIHTGILTINFIDTVKKIIDGSFFFEAYDTLTHETYSITDGRFNLYYK